MSASFPPSFPISFLVEDHLFLDDLQKLPWQHPIAEWREKDVGIIHAACVDAKKFGQESPVAFWNCLARKVREILKMQ